MKTKRLRIYLDDHLALIVAEISLLGRCRRSNENTPLGEYLAQVETEVRSQRALVRSVYQQIDCQPKLDSQVKQLTAWFAEKLGRFKLNDSLLHYSDLSRVLELETLVTAAQMRQSLWQTIACLADTAVSLGSANTYQKARDQAKSHRIGLNDHCLYAAQVAFRGE